MVMVFHRALYLDSIMKLYYKFSFDQFSALKDHRRLWDSFPNKEYIYISHKWREIHIDELFMAIYWIF